MLIGFVYSILYYGAFTLLAIVMLLGIFIGDYRSSGMDFFTHVRLIAVMGVIATLVPTTTYWGFRVIQHEPEGPEHVWEPSKNDKMTKEELAAFKEKQKKYEEYQKKYAEYRVVRERWDRNYFYYNVVVGLIAVSVGMFMPYGSLGTGFLMGGATVLTMGYWIHWTQLDDLIKFISLLLALFLVVFSAIRMLKKQTT